MSFVRGKHFAVSSLLFLITVLLAGYLYFFPIIYSPKEVLLGEAHVGSLFHSSIDIWNFGLRKVTIIEGSSSCLCTKIDLKDATLPPFQKTRIPVTVRTGEMPGPISEKVVYGTDVATNSWHVVRLLGAVNKTLNIEGHNIALGVLNHDKIGEAFKIPLRLTQVSYGRAGTRIKPRGSSQRHYKVVRLFSRISWSGTRFSSRFPGFCTPVPARHRARRLFGFG